MQTNASYFFLEFQGTSMRPTLAPGDRLLCRRISLSDSPDEGDIVGYFSGAKLVVHRVVGASTDLIFTRADSSLLRDSPVNRRDLFCKVVAKYRNDEATTLKPPSALQRHRAVFGSLLRRGSATLARRVSRWVSFALRT